MSTTCCSSSEAPENLENTIASFVINVYEHVIYVVGIENSTLVYKPVPDGVNIFRLFEIEPPEEIDNLHNWTVATGENSTLMPRLLQAFKDIKRSQWNMILPESHYNLLLGLYIPVMILGTSLNLFLLLTILTTKKLRQDPRNSFILALAISDFFLCNFTCPLTLWNTLEGHWPFGGSTTILCKFLKAGQDFPIIMSSFCIGAIACDRFRYIVQNNLPQMTATQGFMCSVLLSVFGASFIAPIFYTASLVEHKFLLKTHYCEVHWPQDYRYHYTVITTAAHYFLTLIIVLVLYYKIYLRLRLRPPSQHDEVNQRRRRTNALLACITIVFFVCWAPMVIFCFIYDFANHLIPSRGSVAQFTYDLTLLFGMLTPIANPILYSLLNENFRDVAKQKYLPRFLFKNLLNGEDIEMKVHGNQPDNEEISGPGQTIEVDEREREVVTKRRLKVSASNVEKCFNIMINNVNNDTKDHQSTKEEENNFLLGPVTFKEEIVYA